MGKKTGLINKPRIMLKMLVIGSKMKKSLFDDLLVRNRVCGFELKSPSISSLLVEEAEDEDSCSSLSAIGVYIFLSCLLSIL